MRAAQLILELLGTSSLYTPISGSADYWLDKDFILSQWRQVQAGERLRPAIYEFRPNAPVTPSKLSHRQAQSIISDASAPRADAFRNELLQRDLTCVITREPILPQILVASHLVPKRLGDAGVQSVIQRFTGSNTIVRRFDPRLGVLLSTNLDCLVDGFEIGFWNSGQPGQVSLLTPHTLWH